MLPRGSIAKVYEYYFTTPQFRDEILRALQEFFDRPDLRRSDPLEADEKSRGFFNEWFLYDFTLRNGQTVLEHFITTNPFGLNREEIQFYRNLLNNNYGIFEVLDVEREKRITIKDLQTGKEWVVREHRATLDLKEGDLFFGRVGKVGDHHELIGADTFLFQDVYGTIKRFFAGDRSKLTPKVANEIWNKR